MRPCTICLREDRQAIDEALAGGQAYRAVARQHGLSKDAVARHHRAHVSPALVRVAEKRHERAAERGPVRALDRLEDLYQRARRLLEHAEAAGHSAQQLAAIREARGLVETIARITGELREQPAAVVNVLQSPELALYVAVVRQVLADEPDRLALIAERLVLPEEGAA